MTFACTDCSRCGKCYEKHTFCPNCGNAIFLLDDKCPVCAEPITDAMRNKAKKAYMERKRKEKEKVLELVKQAKSNRPKAQ